MVFNRLALCGVLRRLPDGVAVLEGDAVRGTVEFYQTVRGVLVVADISGLPESPGRCGNGIFAFHIHSGGTCTGAVPFENAGGHYDPLGCPHPGHAGDMPPLFNAAGKAFLMFLTDRFTVEEVIGKTVIIHDKPDDFTTQPAGNAGSRIACGVITEVRR